MVKRVAVFAAFDANGKIHRYVQTYLRELKKFAQKIIFVCDNDISAEELKKIDAFADAALCQKHGEYDFGSYKRGIACASEAGWLEDADELILCNDSCFCVGDLSVLFNCSDHCDFYGATQSTEVRRHLQSYFMVFKKNVFSSEAFVSFFKNVRRESTYKSIVLDYEVSLTDLLNQNGFKEKAFCCWSQKSNPAMYPITLLLKYNFPFVKKRVFTSPRYLKENIIELTNVLKENFSQGYKEILQYFNLSGGIHLILKFYLRRILFFFYARKVTSTGKVIVKIFKIPVFVSKNKGGRYAF